MEKRESTYKERRTARKEARAAKKAAKKRTVRLSYRELDKKGKYRFWLKIVTAAAAFTVTVNLIVFYAVPGLQNARYNYCIEQQASEEELETIAKPDEEHAAAIDAMEQYSSEDTWAIYIYMCGSSLESVGNNNLSEVTNYLLTDTSQAYMAERHAIQWSYVSDFVSEINAQGMDLPAYLYLPQEPEADEEEELEETNDSNDYTGAATLDLEEMFEVELPENIKVVIQTGGSPRWSMMGVNPNRTQRYVYSSEGFQMVEEKPVQNMGNAETLKDFLDFCEDGYAADHQMILFWNHGGGAFGACNDDLYGGDKLSLKEMQDAFSGACVKDEKNPPFELIGFDACMMANLETTEALHGYGRYLVASEESEPGEGWNYTAWLGELAKHPEMNGAQVGKAIADSFIEYYANQSIQLDWLGVDYGCTLSVVDMDKAHEAYEAYGKLAGTVLKDSFKYPAIMGALGTAATGSVRYADTAYKIFNLLDLGLFMDNLNELYPKEAGEVADAVRKSVLYNRTTAYEQDSQGLSVYFPAEVEDLMGLVYYLNYINEVCVNQDIKALYYYKLAGCLNDELQAYADSQKYGKAPVLDTAPLEQLAGAEIKLEETGIFSMPVDAEASALIQDLSLNIAKYDEKEDRVTYYGEDQFVTIDENGKLYTDFEGKWISLNGHILTVEKIDSTASTIRYRSPVSVNGEDSYLILAYDFDTEKTSILGIRSMEENGEVLERTVNNLKVGDKLQPIYESNILDSGVDDKLYGKPFTYWSNSRVEDQTLKNGTYLVSVTIVDTRGDEYYTPIIQFKMQNGKMTDAEVREDLYNERTAD